MTHNHEVKTADILSYKYKICFSYFKVVILQQQKEKKQFDYQYCKLKYHTLKGFVRTFEPSADLSLNYPFLFLF